MIMDPNEYMGSKAYSEALLNKLDYKSYSIFWEEKLDGMYCSAIVTPAMFRGTTQVPPSVLFTSKGMKRIPNHVLADIERCIIRSLSGRSDQLRVCGELLLFIDGVVQLRAVGNGYINSLIQGGERLPGHVIRYGIWAIWKGTGDTQYNASSLARDYFNEHGDRPCFTVRREPCISPEHARQLSDDVIYRGCGVCKEGGVVKDGNQRWVNGKPNGSIKVKAIQDIDMRVISSVPHTKKAGMIGSLVCTIHGVYVQVGSGLTDADRALPFSEYAGRTVTVTFETFTEPAADGIRSLNFPRFHVPEPAKGQKRAVRPWLRQPGTKTNKLSDFFTPTFEENTKWDL